MARATVLIPTHNHAHLLPYSLQSVINQTVKDIEILVIGDGVQDDTRKVMKQFVKKDTRIRFFDFPKGPRNGEIYRNQILKNAKGAIVCYLSDDDLWFPDHIEQMLKLLQKADFAHSYLFRVERDGSFSKALVNLNQPERRKRMLSGTSYVALSFGAHTLSFYKKLPFGWRTTPIGTYTDHYMWQQFLNQKACRVMSGFVPTALNMPSFLREKTSTQKREDELKKWSKKIQTNGFTESFRNAFFEKTIKEFATIYMDVEIMNETITQIKGTKIWKLGEKLRKSPALRVVKFIRNFFRI